MAIFIAFDDDGAAPAAKEEEKLYLVDVGFGGANLVSPLPLCEQSAEIPKDAYRPDKLVSLRTK